LFILAFPSREQKSRHIRLSDFGALANQQSKSITGNKLPARAGTVKPHFADFAPADFR
jgi:hypothetical protein